ncbi:hypothetical protein [Leucobacter sp. 1207-22]|uniref:hypothetical protein n=1 Tax=Leucobacter sp. 1207-22 TaxID=2604456 RepID=UPI0040639C32
MTNRSKAWRSALTVLMCASALMITGCSVSTEAKDSRWPTDSELVDLRRWMGLTYDQLVSATGVGTGWTVTSPNGDVAWDGEPENRLLALDALRPVACEVRDNERESRNRLHEKLTLTGTDVDYVESAERMFAYLDADSWLVVFYDEPTPGEWEYEATVNGEATITIHVSEESLFATVESPCSSAHSMLNLKGLDRQPSVMDAEWWQGMRT